MRSVPATALDIASASLWVSCSAANSGRTLR
ncbi:MAG: hypothetical protein ACI9P3_001618 [Bradyrhizobium sp.]|jgi:hypothetical protein